MTNRCRANPNTPPDSPLDGESGEVLGFALHLFVTKLQASIVIDYPWRNLTSYAQKVGAFGILCIEKVGAIWHHMQ